MQDSLQGPLRDLVAQRVRLSITALKWLIAFLSMSCVMLFALIVWWAQIPIVFFEVSICAIVFRFAMEPYLQFFSPGWRVGGFLLWLVFVGAVLTLIGLLVAPEVQHQVDGLRTAALDRLPPLWHDVRALIDAHNADAADQIDKWITSITDTFSSPEKMWNYVSGFAKLAPHYVGSAFAMVGYGMIVLFLSMSIVSTDYLGWIARRFGGLEPAVSAVLNQTQGQVGHWFWYQFMLSTGLGLTFGCGLWILGIPFAVAIGLLTVFLDLVPYGNALGLVLALFAVATDLPAHSITVNAVHFGAVVGIWLVITQTSANFIQPRVMNRVLHIHPYFIISFIFLGFLTGGMLGALLAMPVLIFCKAISDRVWPAKNPTVPVHTHGRIYKGCLWVFSAFGRLCVRAVHRSS